MTIFILLRMPGGMQGHLHGSAKDVGDTEMRKAPQNWLIVRHFLHSTHHDRKSIRSPRSRSICRGLRGGKRGQVNRRRRTKKVVFQDSSERQQSGKITWRDTAHDNISLLMKGKGGVANKSRIKESKKQRLEVRDDTSGSGLPRITKKKSQNDNEND